LRSQCVPTVIMRQSPSIPELRRQVTRSQLRGLRSFAEVAHKPLLRWVAFTGASAQLFDGGTEAIPYRELLLQRLPELVL
jgi:hypothetical protein